MGHDAVVGVWPAWWLNDDKPLPGDVTPAETVERPELGSGFSFLKAPSAILHICKWKQEIRIKLV